MGDCSCHVNRPLLEVVPSRPALVYGIIRYNKAVDPFCKPHRYPDWKKLSLSVTIQCAHTYHQFRVKSMICHFGIHVYITGYPMWLHYGVSDRVSICLSVNIWLVYVITPKVLFEVE